MKLVVWAEVYPSESVAKVQKALHNLFPALEFKREGQRLVGRSSDPAHLRRLHELLRSQQILDAARSVMFKNRDANRTSFALNKQAAFVGKLSFTNGESPLGPITVELEAEDLERLIDYLAPKTKDGKPIREVGYP